VRALERRALERWISFVRLIAFPFVLWAVIVADYPPGYGGWAWATTFPFAIGSLGFFVFARTELAARHPFAQSLAAQAFDTAAVAAYVLVFSYERGLPVQQALYLDLAAACVRFQIVGGLVLAAISAPILVGFAKLRTDYLKLGFSWKLVVFQTALEGVLALIVGWLVARLAVEHRSAQARAEEAEELRDELGRRADVLDAVNRCARALSSSLELSDAFGAFIRELRGLLGFDRIAIVLAQDGTARVMAAAGRGSDDIFPPGSALPLAGTLLEDVLAENEPIYRRELDPARYPEEREFLELGLGSRLVAPLVAGTRTIGMISLVRAEPDGFEPAEIELLALLGRVVATAAQNIIAYDAERRNVEELRRLSTLRADFVSVVSHELRSPMAAVIGAARTLQGRWRELSSEHRESFLALIADETNRLATLVADVLDTSRIDAGTFGYTFGDIDVGALVEEAVANAAVAQDEVSLVANVPRLLPTVRGDGARLQQVLSNLIDNAVKYSPDGETVDVRAMSVNGRVLVDVTDRGEGIAPEDHRLIFEKFGRVRGATSKPGTGLGLYIARSIAEAHGGFLDVSSAPGRGTTFTLTLPAE
jgi:signal transduction histidine kinase